MKTCAGNSDEEIAPTFLEKCPYSGLRTLIFTFNWDLLINGSWKQPLWNSFEMQVYLNLWVGTCAAGDWVRPLGLWDGHKLSSGHALLMELHQVKSTKSAHTLGTCPYSRKFEEISWWMNTYSSPYACIASETIPNRFSMMNCIGKHLVPFTWTTWGLLTWKFQSEICSWGNFPWAWNSKFQVSSAHICPNVVVWVAFQALLDELACIHVSKWAFS